MALTHLEEIKKHIQTKESFLENVPYAVPGLWFDENFAKPAHRAFFSPAAFFLRQIDSILKSPAIPLIEGENGEWSRRAKVYNLYVRLATAYDHNQNGQLDFPLNSHGFRETGTFLKSIALLPYLKQLGVNTLHLLPITSVGQAYKKGSLGSPYAARNLYELDPNLSEPFLEMGVEKEFQAFVEAAHHCGMRVVLEFVFRTASRDCDWVKEHPEWFYWIKEEVQDRPRHSQDRSLYGSPLFDPDVLNQILDKVQKQDFANSISPSLEHRAHFRESPHKEQVIKEGDHWIGQLPDGSRVKVPGAFCDWPPSDAQPPWEDVTYLKLYRHSDFNYIAYNTVRMYDAALSTEHCKNEELWKALEDVIPHYQKKYRIDGVMIDMGHALPAELLKKMVTAARTINPDFAFWEENFSLSKKSKEQGYNAALGYLWAVEHEPHKLKELLQRFEKEDFPVPFFGTSESHNTPRSATRHGGDLFSKFSWVLNNFLPVIPFIHNGFELGEKIPVNTGLDFGPEEIKKYSAADLPLFSVSHLNWETNHSYCEWIKTVSVIRNRYAGLIQNSRSSSCRLLQFDESGGFVFERKNSLQRLVLVGNVNFERNSLVKIFFDQNFSILIDLISSKPFTPTYNEFHFNLEPGEILIFDLGIPPVP